MTSTQILTTIHEQLYDTDFVEWVDKAAELLRQGQFSELDIENLIEEVESLGRSEKNAVRSNLRVLLIHLLKWQYQSSKRSSSWRETIVEHRARILSSFEDSPSLRNYYLDVFKNSYSKARKYAAEETGIDIKTLPTEYIHTPEDVLDIQFWPEN